MAPTISARLIFGLCVVLMLSPVHGASPSPSLGSSPSENVIRIEPSRTRVGLASVYLEVSELSLIQGELTGRYRIRVPLRPSRNDVGTLRLSLPGSAETSNAVPVETLIGHAHSDRGGERRDVVCAILDGETLRIDVTTDERVLTFETRYARTAGNS